MRSLLVVALLWANVAAGGTMRPGIWKSLGYGELLVVDSDRFTAYDLTAETCVGRETHVLAEEKNPYYPIVEYPSEDRMVVAGNYYRYSFERIEHIPPQCTAAVDPKDALWNFDVFWKTFEENYAGFAPRGIDWKAIRAKYRPRLTRQTSEKELYSVLGEIVQSINDPHVFITNGKDGVDNISYGSRDVHGIARALAQASPGRDESFYRRGADSITAGVEAVVRYELLGGQFKTAFNDKLTWGMLPDGVAYLRASRFTGLFPGMSREEMSSALEKKLDEIFGDFAGARALVIDVSTNTGGAGFIPHAIARRILTEARVAWTQRYRTPQGFSDDVYTMRLEPSPSVRFAGPVVVVMSNNTVSAGEELPLVLQGAPNVTLVGERTPGALSDIEMKALPNGGLFGLPNQTTLAANGAAYDGRGIPPDLDMVVFDPRSPLSGYAAVIARAAAIARRNAPIGKQ